MAGFFKRIFKGKKAAHRALARPQAELFKTTPAQKQEILNTTRDRLTMDVTRMIAQAIDSMDGLIANTDELLRNDPDAYELIFDDDQITTSIDNAFAPVSQASWSLKTKSPETAKLIPFIQKHALDVIGFKDMIQDLCYAEITGLRISRMIWILDGKARRGVFNVKEFVAKDARRFRPADTRWREMYLIDPGLASQQFTIGFFSTTGFAKPLDRDAYIVYAWRDTENRLGWGKGLGARLFRLASYRKPLINMLLQGLENMAAGIRFAETTMEAFAGRTPAEHETLMANLKNQIGNAIGGDTVILPPGVKVVINFPPNSMGEVILNAIDGYFDQQVSKVINGATLQEDQTSVGSHALGKEHSKTAHMRMQWRADTIGETLDKDYIAKWVKYNPWIFAEAGVDRDTPLPKLRTVVPGGEDIKQRTDIVNTVKVAMTKTQYAEMVGVDLATEEEIARGDSIVPAEIGQGTAMAIPFATSLGAPVAEEVNEEIQKAALNGAQITALQGIVAEVAAGTMPFDSALELVLVGFPDIPVETAKKMLQAASDFDPVGTADSTDRAWHNFIQRSKSAPWLEDILAKAKK